MSRTRATMRDIAEECGVSLSTVSLVLSDNPRISTATRARVRAAVEKMGYEPDIHARGLALRTSRTLSVVVPEINHELSFTLEPLTDPGTASEGKLFQYDESLQCRVLCFIHRAHAALGHLTDYRVFSDLCELFGHSLTPFLTGTVHQVENGPKAYSPFSMASMSLSRSISPSG